jgi:hypothetical protein
MRTADGDKVVSIGLIPEQTEAVIDDSEEAQQE